MCNLACVSGLLSLLASHQTPAALELISLDAVRIAHGLAIRDGEGAWRYACPELWGGPDAAAAASSQGEIWVVGGAGVGRVTLTTPASAVMPADGARELLGAGEATHLLTTRTGLTELWRLSATPRSVWTSTDSWDDALRADGFTLARQRDGRLTRLRLSEGGAPLETTEVQLSAPDGISLRERGRFGIVDDQLWVLTGTVPRMLAGSSGLWLGPVEAGGRTYAVDDGALFEIDGAGALTERPVSARITCMGKVADRAYVCTQTRVWALAADGSLGASLFDMSEVQPPLFDDPGCQAQWLDFAAEAGLDPGPKVEPTPIPEPEEVACGCASIRRKKDGSRQRLAWVIWVGLVFGLGGRSRFASTFAHHLGRSTASAGVPLRSQRKHR